MARMTRSSSLATLKVLRALLDGRQYGLSLTECTGVKSGTIYPLLARLELDGWVESDWEVSDARVVGRPRRRYYRLTRHGRREAKVALAEAVQALSTAAIEPA